MPGIFLGIFVFYWTQENLTAFAVLLGSHDDKVKQVLARLRSVVIFAHALWQLVILEAVTRRVGFEVEK